MIKNCNFRLISFDLDNTLYDNQPVIERAEKLSSDYLAKAFSSQNQSYTLSDFYLIRDKLLKFNDVRYENLSYLRQQSLKELCATLDNANEIAEQAFSIFITARSEIIYPKAIELMLSQLAQKFILVSATNGNCDIFKTQLGQYFHSHWSTSQGFRAKPQPEMLEQIIKNYNLTNDQLLHVGDSIIKDGGSAQLANVSFFEFAPFKKNVQINQLINSLLNYVAS